MHVLGPILVLPACCCWWKDFAAMNNWRLIVCQVCTQTLALPTGVSIISANVAAGHLSSASIYPACFAPYLIATACSDGQVRLWKCSVQDMEPQMRHDNSFNITSYDFSLGSLGPGVRPAVTSSQVWKPQEHDYWWGEWQMMCSSNRSSAVSVPGRYKTQTSGLFCAGCSRVCVGVWNKVTTRVPSTVSSVQMEGFPSPSCLAV